MESENYHKLSNLIVFEFFQFAAMSEPRSRRRCSIDARGKWLDQLVWLNKDAKNTTSTSTDRNGMPGVSDRQSPGIANAL